VTFKMKNDPRVGHLRKRTTPMSLNSINTNVGAQIALQTLDSTNAALQNAQNQVSTGLAIAGPSDNGAIWSIAQGQRTQVSDLSAVTDSLNRAASTLDVAISAGQQISDLLTQLQSTALNATDASLSTSSRTSLNTQFKSLISQITQIVGQASFNGANLIKSGASNLYALASADGSTKLTIKAEILALGNSSGVLASLSATASIGTTTLASTQLQILATAGNNVDNALAELGTSQNAVTTSLTFTSNLSNSLTQGIGNLVDADVAAESATLQALQTKQQLGVQALSIANSSSSVLLSLFRG
jgi:flagellin